MVAERLASVVILVADVTSQNIVGQVASALMRDAERCHWYHLQENANQVLVLLYSGVCSSASLLSMWKYQVSIGILPLRSRSWEHTSRIVVHSVPVLH